MTKRKKILDERDRLKDAIDRARNAIEEALPFLEEEGYNTDELRAALTDPKRDAARNPLEKLRLAPTTCEHAKESLADGGNGKCAACLMAAWDEVFGHQERAPTLPREGGRE